MAVFKCKMCGGNLEVEKGESIGTCDSCGMTMTLPRLDDERRANLYDRANHFRRNNEYDKAAAIFESILNEDRTDAEAYWSLVLCKFGVEYVEDPKTHRKIPTCNRTQMTSIYSDEDYKGAIANADGYQKSIYEEEAKAIDSIQKGILEISQKELPFDVFICYKETDSGGRRTPDSVLANELYHQLTQEGFKVFFSRITLEDKIGTAYEPYIFAALRSSKVMVALGTKKENFDAVWVKNEWSRFLALIKSGAKKTLIPAYKDMDPYDLPDEFSHLQAQDMGKLGFMQDLIRGIKKLTEADRTSNAPLADRADPLVRRAFISLEDGDWQKASDLLEQSLNLEPENARAYVGRLMAELRINTEEGLAGYHKRISGSANFQKALRFADENYREVLKRYDQAITARIEEEKKERVYRKAAALLSSDGKIETSNGNYIKRIRGVNKRETQESDDVLALLQEIDAIGDYKDARELAAKLRSEIAECERKMEEDRLAAEQRKENQNRERYENAVRCGMNAKTSSELYAASEMFYELGDYRDSSRQCLIFKNRADKIHAGEVKESRHLQRKIIIAIAILIGVIFFLYVLSGASAAQKRPAQVFTYSEARQKYFTYKDHAKI